MVSLVLGKDIMPLIDNSQLKKQNKRAEDVVKIVAAVSQTVKCGVLQ